ncbi:MAG: hypothetical protein QM767_21940 [Anaeromyxobacter sp.]
MKTGRIALLLCSAFVVGGASAEVAVRTHRAVEQVQAERDAGAAGQLVSLELASADGQVLASPRFIAPTGKAAELVLHDPTKAGQVQLAFRVEAERQSTGQICLAYELWVPGHDVATRGRVSLQPGVQQSIPPPRWPAGGHLDGGPVPLAPVRQAPRALPRAAEGRREADVSRSVPALRLRGLPLPFDSALCACPSTPRPLTRALRSGRTGPLDPA